MIITNTSPAAMIANGAKYGSSVFRLPPVRKVAGGRREVDGRDQRDDDDAALAQRQEALAEAERPTAPGPALRWALR